MMAEVSRAQGADAKAILGLLRECRVAQARGAFYLRAAAEAGQPLADLARLTGRIQRAVPQPEQRHRGPMQEGKPS